jgi:hypothetical protein
MFRIQYMIYIIFCASSKTDNQYLSCEIFSLLLQNKEFFLKKNLLKNCPYFNQLAFGFKEFYSKIMKVQKNEKVHTILTFQS